MQIYRDLLTVTSDVSDFSDVRVYSSVRLELIIKIYYKSVSVCRLYNRDLY